MLTATASTVHRSRYSRSPMHNGFVPYFWGVLHNFNRICFYNCSVVPYYIQTYIARTPSILYENHQYASEQELNFLISDIGRNFSSSSLYTWTFLVVYYFKNLRQIFFLFLNLSEISDCLLDLCKVSVYHCVYASVCLVCIKRTLLAKATFYSTIWMVFFSYVIEIKMVFKRKI